MLGVESLSLAAVNRLVAGSNPARGANKINRLGHVSGQCARAITNPDNITDNNLAKHRRLGRLARWERHFRATPTLGNGAALAKSKIVLPRHPPKRMITKQQGRPTPHSCVQVACSQRRKIAFAIHLLIQSADKLLIDLVKENWTEARLHMGRIHQAGIQRRSDRGSYRDSQFFQACGRKNEFPTHYQK